MNIPSLECPFWAVMVNKMVHNESSRMFNRDLRVLVTNRGHIFCGFFEVCEKLFERTVHTFLPLNYRFKRLSALPYWSKKSFEKTKRCTQVHYGLYKKMYHDSAFFAHCENLSCPNTHFFLIACKSSRIISKLCSLMIF